MVLHLQNTAWDCIYVPLVKSQKQPDTMGINVYRLRYFYVFVGGCLAGLAGATISLSVSRRDGIVPKPPQGKGGSPSGWSSLPNGTLSGPPLVGTFWCPPPRHLDLQGPATLFGFTNPLFINPNYGFFLQMAPFLLTIIALIIGSRAATRQRLGAPAALGLPYISWRARFIMNIRLLLCEI